MIAPNPKITASTIRTPPLNGWGVSSPIDSSGDRRGADRLAALTCALTGQPTVCGSSATRRSRFTSHTVTLLPHQSAAWGSTGPRRRSSSAAPPQRATHRLGLLRGAHRARSAPGPPNPRAGGPGRRVRCAAPLGRRTPTAVLPASPTVDSSLDPYSQWIRHRPKPSTTSWAVTVDPF